MSMAVPNSSTGINPSAPAGHVSRTRSRSHEKRPKRRNATPGPKSSKKNKPNSGKAASRSRSRSNSKSSQGSKKFSASKKSGRSNSGSKKGSRSGSHSRSGSRAGSVRSNSSRKSGGSRASQRSGGSGKKQSPKAKKAGSKNQGNKGIECHAHWELSVCICEVAPQVRNKFTTVIGLWYADTKPNMKTFLTPFMESLLELDRNGVRWTNPRTAAAHVSKVIAPGARLSSS
ncbi:Microtubule-actin cross-linking factor 1 [Frankliniella fusca]|uniref:Microtubule-actin cross-linking factor 1 n=1 Tax=Frankliniella fusca TaxID=407009 RepID=A0AAE1HG91_9NEOP|nr:Microtubule-actin cross-linking factor 1 [Frankliniella fusca]